MELQYTHDLVVIAALLKQVEEELEKRPGHGRLTAELITENDNYGFTFAQKSPDKRWVHAIYTEDLHAHSIKVTLGNGEVVVETKTYLMQGSQPLSHLMEKIQEIAETIVSKLVDTPEWVVHG